MAIELPALPWAQDALAPHISAETIEYHYGKHHAGYVAKLNAAIEGTDLASKSLVDIIREGGGAFNNA
ncbi:MAG: superoxide dismutase [Fe], partial [Polyangiales bacterium]